MEEEKPNRRFDESRAAGLGQEQAIKIDRPHGGLLQVQ